MPEPALAACAPQNGHAQRQENGRVHGPGCRYGEYRRAQDCRAGDKADARVSNRVAQEQAAATQADGHREQRAE